MVLLGTNVQSRSLKQFALKRDNNPLCDLIIAIMDDTIKNADLNLTPEQIALLPDNQKNRRDDGGGDDDNCKQEQEQWMQSMTPFFESLTPEQQQKLIEAFNNLTNKNNQKRRALAFAQSMLKRAITNQRKRYNNFDDDD
jgi:uncharacterized protein YoaH (UPF0181 family)